MEEIKNIDDYKKWFKEKFDIDIKPSDINYYDTVVLKMKEKFENNCVWVEILGNIKDFDVQYRMKNDYPLLDPNQEIRLFMKPFESFLEKTYRKNILFNKNWPNEPEKGWVLPDNWYDNINDIIRTTIVVKYLDGVEFLIQKIVEIAKKNSVKCEYSMEAKDEGYYAAHLYIYEEMEIPKMSWDSKKINARVEIQITTQLQEVIKKLLHKHYEARRVIKKTDSINWKWDYKSDEFATNYLGHILHYIEGMIMDIRIKQK